MLVNPNQFKNLEMNHKIIMMKKMIAKRLTKRKRNIKIILKIQVMKIII